MGQLRVVGTDEVLALGYPAAVAALRGALVDGLDPAAGPPRASVPVPAGELLVMPASAGDAFGVKLAAVVPGNAARGLPRVQAQYLLMDNDTMQLRAVVDGNALTTLRTPAVAVLPVAARLAASGPHDLVVFGAGPQGGGLRAAIAAVAGMRSVTFVVRDPSRARLDAPVLAATDPAVASLLARASVVVAATSARTPLFAVPLRDDVTVLAVGSHEPYARELPAAVLGRAQVVVEDVATALREAGDVVLAVREGALDERDLIPLAAVVRDERRLDPARPVVVKTVGMAWQDLVVARAVLAAAAADSRPPGQSRGTVPSTT